MKREGVPTRQNQEAFAVVLATGVIYKTGTLADWQAMQIWRIEWLLGASAALLAAILLKRPG
jgi:hypothetical protein